MLDLDIERPTDALDFDHLSAVALAEWPAELRLPVHASEIGHQVAGLAELERSISARCTPDRYPHAILLRTLHWNILRAVHLAFARSDAVVIADLPSVRSRFEEDVKILAGSLHVSEDDRLIIRRYLAHGPALPPARARIASHLVRHGATMDAHPGS